MVGAFSFVALCVFLLGIQVHWDEPKKDRAKLDIHNLAAALRLFHAKTGRYPTTEEGLRPLVDFDALESVPNDPWGNPYQYVLREDEIELASWGADGQPDGRQEDDDIVVRMPRRSRASSDAGAGAP